MSTLTARLSKNRFALKSSSLLIAVALLSSSALAADPKPIGMSNKPLDLNYGRTYTDGNIQLGIQSRACHAKSDDLDIHIRLIGIAGEDARTYFGKDRHLTVTVLGNGYMRNYAVFPGAKTAVKVEGINIDSDFYVPWQVSLNGKVTGEVTPRGRDYQIGVARTDRFCFANDYDLNRAAYRNDYDTKGFYPIFENNPGDAAYDFRAGDFARYCRGKSQPDQDIYYWPDILKGQKMNSEVNHIYNMILANRGNEYLTNRLFYRKQAPIIGHDDTYDASRTEPLFNKPIPSAKTRDDQLYFSYTYPDPNGNDIIKLKNGELVLHTSNRNISSLSLKLEDTDKKTDPVILYLRWDANDENDDSGDNPLGNRLILTQSKVPATGRLAFKAKDSDETDRYQDYKFYSGAPRIYRGTLASMAFLNSNYSKYNGKTPLSLPAKTEGEINLANTDSVTITLKQDNPESWSVAVTGQPIKFAPLVIKGREVISAMKFRDACY